MNTYSEIELSDAELAQIVGGWDDDDRDVQNERNDFNSRTSSGLVNALNNAELLNFGGSTSQSDQ